MDYSPLMAIFVGPWQGFIKLCSGQTSANAPDVVIASYEPRMEEKILGLHLSKACSSKVDPNHSETLCAVSSNAKKLIDRSLKALGERW